MKKIFVITSLILLCLSAAAQGIGSAKDLQEFIAACNNGESLSAWCSEDSTVVLTADIDMSKVKKFQPVSSFNGKFDGKGHSIKGWKTSCGLFTETGRRATVTGIVIDASCTLNAVSKGNEYFAGFIADKNFGAITHCVNYGTVKHKCDYALSANSVGGIVGFNRFVILNCKNYGSITSDSSGVDKEEVAVNIGGIAGNCGAKANTASVIAHCINEGKITAVSSLSGVFAGGITGNAAKSSLKYCTNRGEVSVKILATEDGGTNGVARTGGICGQTKWDILRCYNYGKVTSEGDCSSNTGGICGMPHAELVIADCINYGPVTTLGEQPSQTGGIAGNIGRPVHIRGCSNYGDIRFDGVSSRARSTAGGIVGNIYTPKSAQAGTYVRECINYGNVSAGNGGNKYDASNRNAIHAGGVVGCAESRADLLAYASDCSNFGKVSCSSGRKGDILGGATGIKTGGEASKAWAKAEKPRPDGTTIWGKVTAKDGSPLEGIVVTDGISCIKTSADGTYAFKSDLSKTSFIYLSLPASAVITARAGIPEFFVRIPHDVQAASADFTLETKEPAKEYTVMMIADPQVRNFGVDGSMETWQDRVAPDAEAFRASCPGEVYSINLGDLVYNYMYAWDDYMDIAGSINCPTFNVIGNHDYDQGTLFETSQGDVYYETYVGPTRYSFDLGEIHYVVMNDIMYDRKSTNDKYYYGLDDDTLEWLRQDLSFVPKDRIIVTCTHAQLFKNPGDSPNGSHAAYYRHYKDYLKLLSSYRKVYSWCGHYHTNYHYNYANHHGKDTRHGAPNIECISVARCTGALRLNKEIGPKGEPQGYMVLNVSGDKLEWYYKPIGGNRDDQMKIYTPSRSSDGSVLVNVWNWSEDWTLPQWSEDGKTWTDMTSAPGVDPDYYDLFQTVENKTTRKYCTPATDAYLFAIMPSDECHGGYVRVTDKFGKTYTENISW